MKQVLLVFIGGGFGSALRYALTKYISHAESGFPTATFSANVLGSLIIGIVLGIAAKSDALTQNHVLLLATGFCGGFTTFSTFAMENQNLLKTGDYMTFMIYTIGTFSLALFAVFGGLYVSRYLA